MARIYCKGDCQFSNNDTRTCELDLVELSQLDGPTFHCQQYIKGNKPVKYASIDIERARMAGRYAKPITEGGTE